MIRQFVNDINVLDAREVAIEKLGQLLKNLEAEIGCRLEPHSAPYWLTIVREFQRLNSVSKFEVSADFMRQLRYTELAIAKYAGYDQTDLEAAGDLWAIRPDETDVRSILEVCCLTGLAAACRIDLRRLAMGAELQIVDGDWRTTFDRQSEDLVKIFGARQEKYSNIFGFAGAIGGAHLPLGRGKWFILLAGKNEGGFVWSTADRDYAGPALPAFGAFVEEGQSYRPTFAFHTFTLDHDAWWLRLIEDDIQRRVGFYIDAALLVMRSIALIGEERHGTYRIGHRLRSVAFLMVDRQEIIDRAMLEVSVCEATCTVTEVERALDYLSRRESNRDEVTPGSQFDLRHLAQLRDGKIIVDYNASFSGVRSLFALLADAEGVAGKVRASAFEEAISNIARGADSRAVPWAIGQRLVFEDGTTREVDAAIVVDDAMIVFECKSRALRRVDDVPTPDRIDERWMRLQEGLRQVDSLAAKLASVKVVSPSPVPQQVWKIVPCVITPGVEWIPSRDAHYWFAPDLPRFCAPLEVVDLVRCVAREKDLANSPCREQSLLNKGNT